MWFSAQGTKESFVEEVAFQLGLWNWVSLEFTGIRQASQAEKGARMLKGTYQLFTDCSKGLGSAKEKKKKISY